MPHIRFEQVEKSYGNVRVLPPFDLSLENGEFTVLVGPSGCGKSTTLRMLAGLEHLSGGEIWFDDKPVSHLEPKDRDIAMVFQDYALYPHMSIARNMSFALRLQKVPKKIIQDKVNQVAEMLGIRHLLERKPGELSGGQRQRVAMGRALVRDASTFLFDEPLSNLDAKLRGKMRTELAEMRHTLDKNMVYVTHDQVEAMTLGDRIVVMAHGLIQQQGTPEDLFKAPVNQFVAGFIGSPSMNFLGAILESHNEQLYAKGQGFSFALSHRVRQQLNQTSKNDILIGVRPSAFKPLHDHEKSRTGIQLQVVVAEYLGVHSVLVTRCGKQDVLVEIDSDSPMRKGQSLHCDVDPEDVMVFAKDSGLRI